MLNVLSIAVYTKIHADMCCIRCVITTKKYYLNFGQFWAKLRANLNVDRTAMQTVFLIYLRDTAGIENFVA